MMEMETVPETSGTNSTFTRLMAGKTCALEASDHIYIYIYSIFMVLYGCETWSLTLREEHRLRVFENRLLRRICGPKRDEVAGEWRTLHNEELRGLYSKPNIIRIIKSRRMSWAVI
jgi:hypothetical protein